MGHVKDRWYTKDKRPTARHGKGLRWQVWYRVDGREKCGGSFKIKAIAEKKLVELESNLLRGEWVDESNTLKVGAYLRQYFAARPHSDGTSLRVESMLKNHIDGTSFGDQRIVVVKPSDVQAWVTDRSKNLAPSTLNLLVKMVRGAFAAAVLDRVITRSPFVRISVPRAESERVIPLTVEQVATLADTVRPRYRAMVLTQAGLGVRIGELLALRAQDVNFLQRSVRVEEQIDKVTRERVEPKTTKSKRTLPLPDIVSTALAEHIRRFPPAEDGLLFHTRDGRPYLHEYYTDKVFKPAVIKAKLPSNTTTHDLRHHYASVLLAAGESVVAVAERLGHEDATLVLTTYGHLIPGADDRTRKAIDAAWMPKSDDSGEAATAQGRPQ